MRSNRNSPEYLVASGTRVDKKAYVKTQQVETTLEGNNVNYSHRLRKRKIFFPPLTVHSGIHVLLDGSSGSIRPLNTR
jgi:hypothetical protein